MSDIVKRRSIRVFGAAIKGRGRHAISNQESAIRKQGSKLLMPDACNLMPDMSAELDRIAVGSIL
jgi:hypothetical protein